MTGPRKWHLNDDKCGGPILADGPDIYEPGGVHVIEYSAYEELKDRYEQACESDNAWRAMAEKLGTCAIELLEAEAKRNEKKIKTMPDGRKAYPIGGHFETNAAFYALSRAVEEYQENNAREP